jgi:hypothetical protein
MDAQARWFADRRTELHAQLRHAEMMVNARRTDRLQWEARRDATIIKLNRLTALED